MMLRQFGEWDKAKGLLDIYVELYTQPFPGIDLPRVASIEFVGDDQYGITEFVLRRDAKVRVHAVGESDYYRSFDFGGIEDASTGRLIWRMSLEQSEDAGGALKNRKVDQTLQLQKGTYRLHFKTDDAHSFGRWNNIPPDQLYWGISLYLADPSSRPEDVVGPVQPVHVNSGMRLLDAVEFTREKSPISPWEYFALTVCLIFLASAVVFPPARLLYRRLAVKKQNLEESSQSRRRWKRIFVWIAGINGAVCLIHIVPALIGGRLEAIVANGIPMLAEAWWSVLISLPLASICMVVFMIVAVVVSWRRQLWQRPLRIYYTVVVAAAAGYLVLMNHLRVIVLPA